ncbi:PH domain-containing protein [Pedobacter flavus]|uniref:PH domain-containing protein n=1 Tax=Pedobacter flavus TaxID=3113906 RepID=A0ABU7H3X2_9SPHI|nr:PH domain-containing protein [Pedobacter sp. VNH31]MEE1886001.1 PH domain-containing protein [Pedobacter sp. VNH31]
MEFENKVIGIKDIPTIESIVLTPIEKSYRKVQIYNQLLLISILLIVATLALYFIKSLQNTTIFAIAVGGILLFSFALFRLSYLSFLNKSYAIREHDVVYQTGWLYKKIHVLPFARIQHCTLNSGVFERKFNLSSLSIFTAGGDSSTLKIEGLLVQDAEKLRNFIINKIKQEDEQ